MSGKKKKKAKRENRLPVTVRAKKPLASRLGVWLFEAFAFVASALPLGIVLYHGWPFWMVLVALAYLITAA